MACVQERAGATRPLCEAWVHGYRAGFALRPGELDRAVGALVQVSACAAPPSAVQHFRWSRQSLHTLAPCLACLPDVQNDGSVNALPAAVLLSWHRMITVMLFITSRGKKGALCIRPGTSSISCLQGQDRAAPVPSCKSSKSQRVLCQEACATRLRASRRPEMRAPTMTCRKTSCGTGH